MLFIKVFGKLKQKVIWRYSNETLPNNPGNIKISSWLPQRDILAPQNIKLFITHGGLLGTTEAVVEGVPILGIPVFGDQKMNMAKASARGYGIKLVYKELNERNFAEAIEELLNNPTYKETAVKVSKMFNDRPMTPQEAVVYWTEYAVRHQGAPHLIAQATKMNFISLNLIDVYFVLSIGFLLILYLNFVFLRKMLRKIFKVVKSKKE
ncbi:hypothetical protein PVAND_003646 [Polypedilum vanderplanki]|uniref:UDP-glucuronosyltransferase n=1 Tax=Polypedilum vanderplanki TaxID=319348 RepID=A0A9J6BUP4_POLVA|nr:hypothetical protein PVAND_003646 [Polypedilum vanderplanki]